MKSSARPRLARAFFTIVLILLGTALAVASCVRQTKTAGQAGERAPASPSATTSPTSPASGPSGHSSSGTPPRAALALPPSLPAPYLPLWPFANGQQVRAWEASYRAGGHQPWHLSAQQTALSFTRGYLGYTEIDRVAASTISGRHARVAVGFRTDGGRIATAAVIHLVRYGSDGFAPWEIVGTDDTTLSLSTPSYGARVATRMVVGGRVTGVDESIRVQVRQLPSSDQVGGYCCLPAGGENRRWSTTVTVRGTAPGVLTIAAATGGHLAIVERFAITGVVR